MSFSAVIILPLADVLLNITASLAVLYDLNVFFSPVLGMSRVWMSRMKGGGEKKEYSGKAIQKL